MRYGDVLPPGKLRAPALPPARGPVSEWLFELLCGSPDGPIAASPPSAVDDPLLGEDSALALHCLYELHYRGFAGVDDRWEWDPRLLDRRARLECGFEARLREEVPVAGHAEIPRRLYEICAAPVSSAPSVSAYLAHQGTIAEVREYAVHRSGYQLKEADPHTWAIPRLAGPAKAALVEIQADEYGHGNARDMHQNLFALTLDALGLDTAYLAYVDRLPGITLATSNLISFFGLHRRWRGALVGHLCVFEMTSVAPMGDLSAALRRLGLGSDARHFFDAHVVADAHHQEVAAERLAAHTVRQEPTLARDVVFGAQAVTMLEARLGEHLLRCWERRQSSLLGAEPPQHRTHELRSA